MNEDHAGGHRPEPQLSRITIAARLAGIGAVMLCVAATFAYTGGWLSPARPTQQQLMAAFQDADGGHPGFRRNRADGGHAKGVCVSGWFESSGRAFPLSKATLFRPSRVPVRSTALLFLPAHPEIRRAVAPIKRNPVSSGFADSRFNGLDAFRLVSAAGTVPVRWANPPMQAFAPAGAASVQVGSLCDPA